AAIALHEQLSMIKLNAAIGVAGGEAVAGIVGTSNRFEYTVIGRPVNEAARLTDEAKHRRSLRVLASASVVDRASPDARMYWRRAGEAQLRGINRPVLLYRPVTPPQLTPRSAVARPSLTPEMPR